VLETSPKVPQRAHQTCSRCGAAKVANVCRPCHNARNRAWRAANRERSRALSRKWAAEHREESRARSREYHRRIGYTKSQSGTTEQRRARWALNGALRRGDISKPAHCTACLNATPSHRLHGHHHDYTAPLDVRWLCSECHGQAHRLSATQGVDMSTERKRT
jgi:hypothetical protein